ncbi:hypothetical protein PG994_001768 [Apiospora phragmitis]|uniref:Uncharacterized protein n=1 Tax=Apiospora phragmitis TaxID=2905665 RepID=A0ABR1WUH5_9PEZI
MIVTLILISRSDFFTHYCLYPASSSTTTSTSIQQLLLLSRWLPFSKDHLPPLLQLRVPSRFPLRGPATTHSIFNGRPISERRLFLRGGPLVDFLDFLNAHYDGICRIVQPDGMVNHHFDELREDVINQIDQLLGPHAFELFSQSQGDATKACWAALTEGVDEKLASSEDHCRWSRLNPNKTFALLPDSGLNYSFAQPGHAEANIGYGIPELMVRAVQRSPEIQYRSGKAKSSIKSISIGNVEITKPQPVDKFRDWEEYMRSVRETIRPSLVELHASVGNTHVPEGSRYGGFFAEPRVVSASRLEHRRRREQLSTQSLDPQTPSPRPVQDTRDRQQGHHGSAGLLFGQSMPSKLITLPNHSQLLNRINDDDLQQENKEWPSAEADRYQERFAYESSTLNGSKSYLTQMNRLPYEIFLGAEDASYAMAFCFLHHQNSGPIYQESMVNYLLILANFSIAAERFSRDSCGPESMQRVLAKTRESLWQRVGIKEFSSEHTATRTNQTTWAKECRTILRGLSQARCKFDSYPMRELGQKLPPKVYSRKEMMEMMGKQSTKMSNQPKRPMVFIR